MLVNIILKYSAVKYSVQNLSFETVVKNFCPLRLKKHRKRQKILKITRNINSKQQQIKIFLQWNKSDLFLRVQFNLYQFLIGYNQINKTMDKVQTENLKLMKKKQKRTEGRWTKKQQQVFLKGLNTFGKNWKQIKELLPSRSLTQIRSHAQKYFIRIKNEKYNSEDEYSDDNSFDAEVSYVPKFLKNNHLKEDSVTHQHFIANTQAQIDVPNIENNSEKDLDQNNFPTKIEDLNRNSLFKEPTSEQTNSCEVQCQVNESIPNDWYSSGPSVFHQMMLYYQNQINNYGTLFPLVDYQSNGYNFHLQQL